VFHDMYGHLPFLADRDYAAFCERFGRTASRYGTTPERLRELDSRGSLGDESPLIETPSGRRIFGGGILSSFGESSYALSDAPEVRPFDLDAILRQEYRIDERQQRLFVVDQPETLYACLTTLTGAC